MCIRETFAIALVVFVFSSDAKAAECDGRVFQIDDLDKATDFYSLYVKSRTGINYGVIGNCAELYGGVFTGPVTFFIRNKFHNFKSVPVGILRIKSVRTFAGIVGPRIKVSRHAGWFVPTKGDPSIIEKSGELPDVELKLTPSQWTIYHAGSDDVAEINNKLGLFWHGYAAPDKSLPSTDTRGYWSFNSDGDVKHQTLTNYLIRFSTAADGENIEFYADIPLGVQRIDLSIDSNMELVAADYTFYVRGR